MDRAYATVSATSTFARAATIDWWFSAYDMGLMSES